MFGMNDISIVNLKINFIMNKLITIILIES